ncbi:MAG: glycosyltransferase family 2 protein [Treponema sp.]|nr:glycosyltransferase family 2 protein [Treponema sp.]
MRKRFENAIISLTSYPGRIGTVSQTIKSLLNQTKKVESIVLWLAVEEFTNKEKDLPKSLLDLTKEGLTIDWCYNLKSYKKLIPSLKKYPEKIIITFDDDNIYDERIVETLHDCHVLYPNDIISQRISRLYINEDGEFNLFPRPMYYNHKSSIPDYLDILKDASYFNKLTGGSGVLYPPGCLHDKVIDENEFLILAPTNDDLWFWLQAVNNKRKIRVPEIHFPITSPIRGTQEIGLTNINDKGGLFDEQFKNILEAYPEIRNTLKNENSKNLSIINEIIINDKNPLISVVCFTSNDESTIYGCLNGILSQSILITCEIIILDKSSTDKTLDIVNEFIKKNPNKIIKVYNNKNYISSFLNSILPMLKGKYIAFCKGNDCWQDQNKLNKQYIFMERNNSYSVTSSGYKNCKNETIDECFIKYNDIQGFDFSTMEIRGYSHWYLSTLFCRKNTLFKYKKNILRFKLKEYCEDAEEMLQIYFLLKSGPGRYSQEMPVTHYVKSTNNDISEKNKIIMLYNIYKELYKKTKDLYFYNFYYNNVRLILSKSLYKNKMDKINIYIKYYTKDFNSIFELWKKILKRISSAA